MSSPPEIMCVKLHTMKLEKHKGLNKPQTRQQELQSTSPDVNEKCHGKFLLYQKKKKLVVAQQNSKKTAYLLY